MAIAPVATLALPSASMPRTHTNADFDGTEAPWRKRTATRARWPEAIRKLAPPMRDPRRLLFSTNLTRHGPLVSDFGQDKARLIRPDRWNVARLETRISGGIVSPERRVLRFWPSRRR